MKNQESSAKGKLIMLRKTTDKDSKRNRKGNRGKIALRRKERENMGSRGGRKDRLSYERFLKMVLFTNNS